MAGFIDTHNHILPGLDDGAPDMETALTIAEAAIADGIVKIVATPHSNFQFSFHPEKVRELQADLQERLQGRLEIATGCELHITYENIRAVVADPAAYCLGGSRYVLVEFPEYFDPPAMEQALIQLLDRGLVPVLAHPERNPLLRRQHPLLLRFLRLGCLTQVTAASFTGRFGREAEQAAETLLSRGLIHFIASDAHSPRHRPPQLAFAVDLITRREGAEVAEALAIGNPAAMLKGEPLPFCPEIPEERRRRGLLSFLRIG